MLFTVYRPQVLEIPDAALIGLAERANKRLGAALQSAVDTDELLLQAHLDKIVDLPVDFNARYSWFPAEDRLLARDELVARGRLAKAK